MVVTIFSFPSYYRQKPEYSSTVGNHRYLYQTKSFIPTLSPVSLVFKKLIWIWNVSVYAHHKAAYLFPLSKELVFTTCMRGLHCWTIQIATWYIQKRRTVRKASKRRSLHGWHTFFVFLHKFPFILFKQFFIKERLSYWKEMQWKLPSILLR